MDDSEMKKNAEFLIQNLAGLEVPGRARVTVRYKNLVSFAEIYGITNPKYVGTEEDEIIACHGFANYFTIKALYKLLIGMKVKKGEEERPVIKNPGKLLHAGQIYDWEGCVDLKPGDKLTITAKWGDVWLVEKNMVLFADLHVDVKNQNDEYVCKPTVRAAIRPGGY